MPEELSVPCSECLWRLSNQGKPHPHGFYTKKNLTRLWNQIRKGGGAQSCHSTDPSHPDHGAKPDAATRECPGSVIVVLRELKRLANADNVIGDVEVKRYLKKRKRGLTGKGILYWVLGRYQLGDTPYLGEGKLPLVNVEDAEIGLPAFLKE